MQAKPANQPKQLPAPNNVTPMVTGYTGGAYPKRKTRAATVLNIGFCHCGCGQKTRVATRTARRVGHVKGQPLLFLTGHSSRVRKYRPVGNAFCECGCGEKTKVRSGRYNRFLKGHFTKGGIGIDHRGRSYPEDQGFPFPAGGLFFDSLILGIIYLIPEKENSPNDS